MKRWLGAALLFVMLTSPSISQISIGIKGGLNFANVLPRPAYHSEGSRTGFSAGGYLELTLPYLFSIQPEVLYSTKGFTSEFHDVEFGAPYTLKQTFVNSYIDVPILLKFTLPVSFFKPSLYAGPDIGFLIGAKEKILESGTVPVPPTFTTFAPFSSSSEDNLLYHTMRVDYGVAVGLSVHVFAANLDARYTFGLKKVTDDRPDNFNRVWSMMLELPFFRHTIIPIGFRKRLLIAANKSPD